MSKQTEPALLELISFALTLPFALSSAFANAYPILAVKIIVGFPEGGPMDLAARLVSAPLSERLGQPFVVENHPGESGNLATSEVIHAAPDGYTLLLCGPVNVINTTLFSNLGCKFDRDVAAIGGISRVPLVIETNPSTGLRTVPQFLAYARSNPGMLKVAYAGNGTPQHIGIELFKRMAEVDMTLVPYLGSAPALADLLANKVQVMFDPLPSSMAYIRNGKLVPLAVTGPARLELLPDVPAASEFIVGYEADSWFGLVAPHQTPWDVVVTLNRAMSASLAGQAVSARLAALGATAMIESPTVFSAFLEAETARYAKVIKSAGIAVH